MMLIDCHTCPVRGTHCADCMVTALAAPSLVHTWPTGPEADAPAGGRLAAGPETDGAADLLRETMALDPAERRAVSVLLAAGLFSRETAGAARAVREPAGSVRRSGARVAG